MVPFLGFLSIVADKVPLPFEIFSGGGGTDWGIKACLIKDGVEAAADAEVEREVTSAVVVEVILTLAPRAFTRLGISSKLTTGARMRGLSLDPFAGNTACCLLPEVSRLRLGVSKGFEVLLAEFWPPTQAFVWSCARDALDAGSLHIEPCLLSQCDWKTCGLTT